MLNCGGCRNSRRNSENGVYCRLFGITIHKNHEGCKYHTGGMRANGTTGKTGAETGLAGMNRSEYEAIRCLLGAVSYTAHAKEDLQKRLECIPGGRQRMNMVLGGLKAIADDLIGTVPVGQCKQIRNTMQDMDMRMVPKLTPMSQNVIFDKDIAKELVDAAMEKCHGCVEGPEDGKRCPLYKVLESFLPLDNYENGMLCPYSTSEWID